MAVEDKYVDSNVAAGSKTKAPLQGLGDLTVLTKTFEVAAADDNNSVYRIANLPATLIPIQLQAHHDAITAGTDYNCGLHTAGVGGAAKDDNVFADAVDLSSAAKNVDLLQTLDVANREKPLYELAGDTLASHAQTYDLTLTGIAVGSAAGTITVTGLFARSAG